MTDKELLKLAAKAVGIEHPGGEHSIASDGRLWDCNELRWWNPLTDDGAALRLAVKLHFSVLSNETASWIAHGMKQMNIAEEYHDGKDPYAATRRAIVRAAAELGKNL